MTKLSNLEKVMLERLELYGYITMRESSPDESNALRNLARKGFAKGIVSQLGPAWRLLKGKTS